MGSLTCYSLVPVTKDEHDQYFEVAEPNFGDLGLNFASNSVLQLAHFSVKEYLVSDGAIEDFAGHFDYTAANTSMAKVCVMYLLYFDQDFDLSLWGVDVTFPLAKYSAYYWLDHASARKESDDKLLHELILKLFTHPDRAYFNWLCLYLNDTHLGKRFGNQEDGKNLGLHCASSWGLRREVEALLAQGADVNTRGFWECKGNWDRTAPNARDFVVNGTPLIESSCHGHRKIVQLLLDAGAELSATGIYSENALDYACRGGHLGVAKMLLERSTAANDGKKHFRCGAALAAASEGGYWEIVQLLLENEFDVNSQGMWEEYGAAAVTASGKGHKDILLMLLRAGADINAASPEFGLTPLKAASLNGHREIVRILLENGADVNTGYGWHHGIVQLL